ncbi:MAG TPA: YkgJ family cysteine cluster protein [Desulfuromonadales bacterium]|nr:YkgJ family cysteine cluster protein [Desulfuromonadales bacterium]
MSFFRKRKKLHGMLFDGPQDGSRCSGCDASCCRGFPTVRLKADEYDTLEKLGAKRLEFTLDESFYLVIENGCEFLDDNRCTIYEHRPDICRRFSCREE